MFEIKMVNPEGLHAPVGPYCQVAAAKASQFVFLAGQTATDHDGKVVGAGDFEAQCRQVFANVETALQSVGAGWRNVVHFTNYLVDPDDQPKFVKFRMGFFPKAFPDGYPPNTLLYVGRLLRTEFLVEVQAIAVI
jgi:enamine deaminase RidA (YjgF/YER057c/UK114 family)